MPAQASPSKRELTHERILDAASRAIRRAGHTGASVAEVMKEAGLTHGGFYAHFDSREKMVASAIAHAGTKSAQNLAQSMAVLQKKGRTPFQALIQSYLSPAHMAAVETGCVVAALGSEMPRQADDVRNAARERVNALVRLVESVLPPGTGNDAAACIASTLVGALQLARALGGVEGEALLAANRRILSERYGQVPG
ncbi:MAG: TetR/AcrR family transcriptional regulator [Oxalobacteraceae bacterium]|jgi:AcrR family transcriptional regulator|nr:MAG: TetR/AcrR family transcriptional regulator [Oxalobacteraceae bacterium]